MGRILSARATARRRSHTTPATQRDADDGDHRGADRADVALDAVVLRAEQHAGAEQRRVPQQRARGRSRARNVGSGISDSPAGTETRLRTPGTSRPNSTIGTARRSNQRSARSRSRSVMRSSGCSRSTARRPPSARDRVQHERAEHGAERRRRERGHERERPVRDLEAGERQHQLRRDRREHGLDRHHDGDPRVAGLDDGVLDVSLHVGEHPCRPRVATEDEENMRACRACD